ncbi:STS14 protein, partial [Cajanus cajan]|uniref:STS14 protein n=1 Tax=Cajanus cajan TaxID=3821 RepID=UPI0010FADD52
MKTKKMIFPRALFLLAAAVAAFHVASSAEAAAAGEFLEAHNEARAAVGVQPLRWSEQVANVTERLVRYQRMKMGCQFASLTAGKYGANQLWA